MLRLADGLELGDAERQMFLAAVRRRTQRRMGRPPPEPPRGACHLTLTGTGGVGLTRLALQIATELETSFADDLGYFENQYGEQAVFVYDCHSNKAVLYLGDAGWETQHAVVNGAVPDLILSETDLL